MIPENWLNKLEEYKSKTYDEVYAEYNKWIKGKPLCGSKAYSDDMQYDSTAFWKDWINVDPQKSLEKGWDTDTYFSNYVWHRDYMYPSKMQSTVKKYFTDKAKSNWIDEGENYKLSNLKFNASGYPDTSIIKRLLEYNKADLAKTKIKFKAEKIQKVVDATQQNIDMLTAIFKEVDTYWASWDKYNELWKTDINDYDAKWQAVLNELKNIPAPTETTEETTSPVAETTSPEAETTSPVVETAQPEETTEPPNVLSKSQDNTFQKVSSSTNTPVDPSTNNTHTRIYEYIKSTIQLDEMSIPVADNIDSDNTIDPSTKTHTGDSNVLNVNTTPYETKGNKSTSKTLSIGVTYPLLRINDHYYTDRDIKYFSLETIGFIPMIEVSLECMYNDILKNNMIKDGDKCSVFINQGHGTLKSYRGDFQITTVKVSKINQLNVHHKIKIKFVAELFVPGMYDATQTFAFSGSSRDALIDAAQKMGLGFFFSDPENTTDVQMWYSMSDGEQKSNGQSPFIQYVKNVASHAYKNFTSFYDCWIDPRYAISFINIAQMLGGSGLDEEIDLAVFNSTLTIGRGNEGENRESSDEKKKNNPKPQLKLLTNFCDDENSITTFLVTEYAEENDNSVSNKLGLSNANFYSIKNAGIKTVADNSIEMNLSIPVNNDKLKNGFYIMAGPGQNLTYTQANNGSYTQQHKSVQGGQIAETQSDVDATDIMESGNNMLASGNTNKFYETADGHNLLCNEWLKKKTIKITLNGCNMQMMRGEKIPVLLKDNFEPTTNLIQANDEKDLIYQRTMASSSGWFIIKNIKWVYDRNKVTTGSQWRTYLTLTRREWPIPGYVKDQSSQPLENTSITVENNINNGSTKQSIEDQLGTQPNNKNNQPADTANNSKSTEVTTNGLNDYLIQIYNDIKDAMKAAGKNIKLVSGRRWPVDENGNIVDKPTVQDGNLWKYKNANGDIVWYESKNSPHNTGDAIDIINDVGTDFKDIMTYMTCDNKTIYDMLINGCYCAIEVSKDDTNNSIKHYHIGRANNSNSDTMKSQSTWWNNLIQTYNGKSSITYNGHTVQLTQYLKYSNKS